MAHRVKCFYCGQTFDRDKEPFVPIPDKRRYAHEACHTRSQNIAQQNKEDAEALDEYIKELFHYKAVPEAVKKQIRQYIAEYNYTYSGILKSLKYHYEVKNGSTEKAFGRIGIVPYVYQDAFNYYYALWEAKQKNSQVEVAEYVLPTTEIHIQSPERKPMRGQRRLFSFLEDAALIPGEETE